MDRFPVIQVQDTVVLNEDCPVEIIIKAHGASEPLHITAEGAYLHDVPVQITIDKGEAFEITGKDVKYYKTIDVPLEEKDSDSIVFLLRAKNPGIQRVC